MSIGDELLRPSANNLTLARLVLATSVIYSHCLYAVTGVRADAVTPLFGVTLGDMAVDGFFTLSGLLVYRSLRNGGSVPRFALARVTRLWPGLMVMLLLTVAGGALATSAALTDYLGGRETMRFLLLNGGLLYPAFHLTGVWCGDAPCQVNGSLWTLPWEARCYLLLGIVGLAGARMRGLMLGLVLPLSFAGALLWHGPGVREIAVAVGGEGFAYNLDGFDRLWFAFLLGILAYEARRWLVLRWDIALVLGAVAIGQHALAPGLLGPHPRALFVGYLVLCLGFLTARRDAVSADWPDWSYGIYIYAYPLMLACQGLVGFTNPYALMLANLAVTLPLAAASWRWVEKPALDRLRRRQPTAFAAPPAHAAPALGAEAAGAARSEMA